MRASRGWIVLFAGLLFIPWIGQGALWDRDETYYAEVAREMLETGSWLLPQFDYAAFYEKPAAPYWIIRTGFSLFGVNEFGARFFSALFGIGTALLAAGIGRRLFGDRAGLLSGLILSSSLLFIAISRSALTDPPFLFFFTAALYFFVRARTDAPRERRHMAGMYASMGFAVLMKGPVGALLPGTIVLLHTLILRRLNAWRSLHPSMGFLLLLLVAGPWYAYMIFRTEGEFFLDFFVRHNIQRFLSPMQGHQGPLWYYVPVLLAAFLPWSVFFPQAVPAKMDRTWAWFLGLWAGVPFVFFSLAGTKLPHYILPIFPPLAVWVAVRWTAWLSAETEQRPRLVVPLLVLVGATALLPAAAWIARVRWPALLPTGVIAASAVLPIGAAAAFTRHGRPRSVLIVLSATMLVFILTLASWAIPSLDTIRVVKPVGVFLRGVGDGPVYAYRFFEPGLVFYARRQIRPIGSPEEIGRILAGGGDFTLVVRTRDAHEIMRETNGALVPVLTREGICENRGKMDLAVLRRKET